MGIECKSPLPIAIADYRNVRVSRSVVLGHNSAAQDRRYAQRLEEIACGILSVDPLWLFAFHDGVEAVSGSGEYRRQHVILVSKVLQRRIGESVRRFCPKDGQEFHKLFGLANGQCLQ